MVDGGPYNTAIWSNATPDSAIFQGTADTVTLGAPITAGGLTFAVDGYTVTGNTLALGGTTTVSAGTATIASAITGSLTKDGGGALTLSSGTGFTGPMTIDGGVVTFNVEAGTVTGGPTPGVDLRVGAINSNIEPGAPIIKTGAGVMQLSGANTCWGATTVSAGELEITNSLGASAVTVGAVATLRLTDATLGGSVTASVAPWHRGSVRECVQPFRIPGSRHTEKGYSMTFKIAILTSLASVALRAAPAYQYEGTWVAGDGDARSLKLIDQAFDSLAVSKEMVSLSLFYKRDWDGLVLSNTAWPGWWIQNTYGPSYGMMPFLEEPYATWMKHAQGMWFRLMGDGETADTNGYIGPEGSLVDCTLVFRGGGRDLGFGHFAWPHSTNPVNDGKITQSATYFRQGDAGHDTNDWGIGFSAAGLVMECERLLVTRDLNAVKSRLPQLKRVAAHLDGRRDPNTNLLRGGKGSNLLAPSFDGWTDANGQKQHV